MRSSCFSSQGLSTSASRCLEVWINTPPSLHTLFFRHCSFPPLHFSLKKINTLLPPQVARGGAAGMERRGGRRSVESWFIWACQALGGLGRCLCVLGEGGGGGVLCVYNRCRERSVSPTLAPGLAQRKPLSVSLGCVYVCVYYTGVQQCDSSKWHSHFFSCPLSHFYTHSKTTHTHINTKEWEKVSICDVSPDAYMILWFGCKASK